jgi:stage II sporulation protein D
MMKALFAALLLGILMASPVWATDTIKVLILDGQFDKLPEEGEKLTKLGDSTGKLIVGPGSYQGDFEVWRGQHGLHIINELPLEDYVAGVVKAETGENWAYEALKAQALIVRTYVIFQKHRNEGKQFHVTSSVLHQIYKGENADSMITQAVRETAGEILMYNRAPIVAYYHSTSGGRTELPEEVFGESYPYLTSVHTECNLSPLCLWIRRVPLREIGDMGGIAGIEDMQVVSHTATGRVREVEIVSSSGTATYLAKDLRRTLGWKKLPSTWFTLRVENETAAFEGKGYGHGVGLDQWGALEMALNDKDYREIVSFFYPGTEITVYENSGF